MNEIVLMADPRVAAVPVTDCGEPLADVRLRDSLAVDDRCAERQGRSPICEKGF